MNSLKQGIHILNEMTEQLKSYNKRNQIREKRKGEKYLPSQWNWNEQIYHQLLLYPELVSWNYLVQIHCFDVLANTNEQACSVPTGHLMD
jgi:hypothetical protein